MINLMAVFYFLLLLLIYLLTKSPLNSDPQFLRSLHFWQSAAVIGGKLALNTNSESSGSGSDVQLPARFVSSANESRE